MEKKKKKLYVNKELQKAEKDADKSSPCSIRRSISKKKRKEGPFYFEKNLPKTFH